MERARVYRRKENENKTYELYANFGKDRVSVGTTQTVTTVDTEKTLSVYLREEFGKATCEVWVGIITPNLKKFERQFFSDMDLEKGVQAINEFYNQMSQVYNGTDGIIAISERMVDVSKLLRDERQKPLNAT